MRKFIVIICISLLLISCSEGDNEPVDSQNSIKPSETATPVPTDMQKDAPTPDLEEYTPSDPFDTEGRAVAVYGTPLIDGTIDPLWEKAGIIIPNKVSSSMLQASGQLKLLWDDNALYTLYIVTDPDLDKSSSNAYEQDSVEIFLDEANDKASSYQSDDVHYRVNYDNFPTTDAGDTNRFFTATSSLTDDSNNLIGYIVETSLTWTEKPTNNQIMGFELQINDADTTGIRIGTVNIFDQTGTAWSNPSSMGEIILIGKETNISSLVNSYKLSSYIRYVETINPKGYINSYILTEPMDIAKKTLDKPSITQEEINIALDDLRTAVGKLDDGSGFVKVNLLEATPDLPEPFTFFNGDKVVTKDDWTIRAKELSELYQYYMYGALPETSDEEVTYNIEGNNLNITVEKGDKKVTFAVSFSLPDKSKVAMPDGGYPVLIAYLWLTQTQYANDNGYGVMTLNTEQIAADNTSRTGAFYELYPYGDIWQEQTGVLLAWSWGISKILDALEAGAGAKLGINPDYNIVTGVSRWGKAAAVAGAFDKRIKVTAPSCSGAGGMAAFRYPTAGNVYDYSSIGASSAYTMTANEPLSSLQSSGERQWFNDYFLDFKDVTHLPFDQHLLASLYAQEGRYLFITGSYLYEDWTNPPAMWLTYLAAKEIYDYLEISDNIAIHIHKEGHMVTDEDMVYLLDYCDYHFYGKESDSNLSDLTTSLYNEPLNYDSIFDRYTK
jgi:endo-1,4-beta-xylanase